jgi:uncharacterized protein YycO
MIGQVGVVRHGTSWVARGIEAVTRSPAFHCVVGIGGGQAIGAEPGGARIRDEGYWPDTVWSQFFITERQAKHIADWARKQEGKPYAYLDDALLGLRYEFGWKLPGWAAARLSSDEQWMCSELACAALMLGGGINAFPDRKFCEVAPADFLDLFLAEKWITAGKALAMARA